MRVVLHAGLHKSGTTTVQFGWRQAYADGESVWYPADKGAKLPGHHGLVWPLLDAFTERRANDLVWGSTLSRRVTNLTHTVEAAVERGVDVLLISTEELDRIAASDVDRFTDMLDGHDVTVLITATRPLHRWCSGWQELVKHGLSEYPRDAAEDVMAFASLSDGRLEELFGLFPASRRVVRVVRTSPLEESLAQDLAELIGLDWPAIEEPAAPRNISMGADVEILRRINRADLALGTVHGGGRQVIARLTEDERKYEDRPELAARYEPPPQFWASAARERQFLTEPAAASGVEVVDPHGQLADWLDDTPPAWYDEISRREVVLPDLDVPVDTSRLLWRVRQERSALRVLHERAEAREAALQVAAERTAEAHRKELVDLEKAHRKEVAAVNEAWSQRTPYRRVRRVAGRVRRRLKRSVRSVKGRLRRDES